MGTSTPVYLPARMASTAIGACHCQGVAIRMASSFSSSSTPRQADSVPEKTRGLRPLASAAMAAAREAASSLRSHTAATSTAGARRAVRSRAVPRFPVPMTASRTSGRSAATEREDRRKVRRSMENSRSILSPASERTGGSGRSFRATPAGKTGSHSGRKGLCGRTAGEGARTAILPAINSAERRELDWEKLEDEADAAAHGPRQLDQPQSASCRERVRPSGEETGR